jgi:hypothetical protein
MIRAKLKVLPTAILLLLMVSCHPEGCYGPRAFNYNTTTVAVSDLVGTYTFDGTNASVLNRLGFTNHSGFISLQPDLTFVCSNVPCVVGIPKPGVYLSSTGKWRTVKRSAIWEVELYDGDFDGRAGFVALSFPVVGESPPYGIQLTINHDEGYWVRYRRSRELP